MTKAFKTLLFIALPLTGLMAQNQKNLERSKHIYTHGNSVLVGNNLLGHDATAPLMKEDVANDEIEMRYIDVDQNSETFSSSRARITNIPDNSKIAYAALYWSALYPYKEGRLRTHTSTPKYVARGEREAGIETVLFEVPGKEYQSITGEIIKDGHGNSQYEGVSPYVCRADVTDLLKNLSDANGTYTVANVRAAEGKIPGGGSAGWLLYVVYENEQESLKYFTTYDGLVDVDRNVVDIYFSDFKSAAHGKITPTLGISVLEGDRKIKTDGLLLYSEKEDAFLPLSNSLREERNFFNSSITINDALYEDREPNSSNTLGFDLLKFEIPNGRQEFFDENTTEATLRFETRADRFYLFFVAFDIDLDTDYYEGLADELVAVAPEEETQELAAGVSDGRRGVKVAKDDVTPEVEAQKSVDQKIKPREAATSGKEVRIENGTYAFVPSTEADFQRIKDDIRDQDNRVVPGVPAGYFLVTNVFEYPRNAKRWREFLIEKDYVPATFLNPENDYEYIYVDSFSDLDEGFSTWRELYTKSYFEGLWLMKVNMHSTDVAEAY